MGNYRDLLVALAKNPAMIYWLDNCENHAMAVNENWGRELLELFSMGGRATTRRRTSGRAPAPSPAGPFPKLPRAATIGRHDWDFEYREEDHDEGEKTFLGHTGNFDGEDIIDIIVQQPACHRFICPPSVQLLRRRRSSGAGLVDDAAADPEADRYDGQGLAGVAIRHALDVAGAVQLRLLQKCPLCQNQKSRRKSSLGSLRMVGGFEFPAPGIGNLRARPDLHGAGTAEPAQCRRMAHRR